MLPAIADTSVASKSIVHFFRVIFVPLEAGRPSCSQFELLVGFYYSGVSEPSRLL
jgi:hypothetical protein